MINPEIEDLLLKIGLSDKARDVYLTLFQQGPSPASKIAKSADLKRPTTYDVLAELKTKGLVSEVEKRGVRYFRAETANQLVSYLDQEISVLKNQKNRLNELLPQILSMAGGEQKKTIVKYFEGQSGFREVAYDQTFSREVLSISNTGAVQQAFSESVLQVITGGKKKRKVKTRLIIPDDASSKAYIPKYYPPKYLNLFEVRTVPAKQFKWLNELNVYENKIALFSLETDNREAIIIESPQIAQTMKVMFELAWQQAKPLKYSRG